MRLFKPKEKEQKIIEELPGEQEPSTITPKSQSKMVYELSKRYPEIYRKIVKKAGLKAIILIELKSSHPTIFYSLKKEST